jgi:hypothetical protein
VVVHAIQLGLKMRWLILWFPCHESRRVTTVRYESTQYEVDLNYLESLRLRDFNGNMRSCIGKMAGLKIEISESNFM